jgi:predicted nucleic acid-binding protein
MRTAIDSSIVSAILGAEPTSAALVELLGQLRRDGSLSMCGTVFAEIHAVPGMTGALLRQFLSDTSIEVEPATTQSDWRLTGERFCEYAARGRASRGGDPKRLLADFAVGAHASNACDQLLTLDPDRYRTAFTDLTLVSV